MPPYARSLQLRAAPSHRASPRAKLLATAAAAAAAAAILASPSQASACEGCSMFSISPGWVVTSNFDSRSVIGSGPELTIGLVFGNETMVNTKFMGLFGRLQALGDSGTYEHGTFGAEFSYGPLGIEAGWAFRPAFTLATPPALPGPSNPTAPDVPTEAGTLDLSMGGPYIAPYLTAGFFYVSVALVVPLTGDPYDTVISSEVNIGAKLPIPQFLQWF